MVVLGGGAVSHERVGVPREQKMLKGHLPRVIYHRVYSNIRRVTLCDPRMTFYTISQCKVGGAVAEPPRIGWDVRMQNHISLRMAYSRVFHVWVIHETPQ